MLTSSGSRRREPRVTDAAAELVYLAVEGFIYGPFTTGGRTISPGASGWDYALKASIVIGGKPRLYKISESEFNSRYEILRREMSVSYDEKGKNSSHLIYLRYEYLPPDACAKIREEFGSAWEELDWEPLSVKFSRMMGVVKSFSRTERQQLKDLVTRREK